MIPKSLALSFLLFSQERSPPVHLIYSCPSFRFQLSHHSLREALNLQLLLTWSVSPLHSFSVPRNFSICSYYSFNYPCIYLILCLLLGASLVAQMVKDQPAVQETWVWSLGWKILWRREWLPASVFLPGEFHGQRSLGGYSPWDRKVSDTTELLTQHASFKLNVFNNWDACLSIFNLSTFLQRRLNSL